MGYKRLNQRKEGFFCAYCPKADIFRKPEWTPRREKISPFSLKWKRFLWPGRGQRHCDVHGMMILPLEGSEGRFSEAAVREELHTRGELWGREAFCASWLAPGEVWIHTPQLCGCLHGQALNQLIQGFLVPSGQRNWGNPFLQIWPEEGGRVQMWKYHTGRHATVLSSSHHGPRSKSHVNKVFRNRWEMLVTRPHLPLPEKEHFNPNVHNLHFAATWQKEEMKYSRLIKI